MQLHLSQKGYIPLVLIIFALLIAVLIFPYKFPVSNLTQNDGFQFCREFVDAASAPVIDLPTSAGGTTTATYRLIKENVPIRPRGYQGTHHIILGGNTQVNSKNFEILYPNPVTGKSYDFNTEDGKTDIKFDDYGIIFLRHLTDALTPVTIDENGQALNVIDIYQDTSKPPLPQAENILKCIDVGTEKTVNPEVIFPDQNVSADKKQVQMEWFVIKQDKLLPKAWWTPECKPAIYLYPPQKKLVNVKVFPAGQLTYVDPPYDLDRGWTVWVEPNGQLQPIHDSRFTIHDYLYYESKIYDIAINKPDKGWVVEYERLENLYNEVLPKLGLNQKEKDDFIEYWTKALPKAPYYFIGIIDSENVDQIERLEITPKPDSINRVRIYFERLDTPKVVKAPDLPSSLSPHSSSLFHVTEWGGMVKTDPNHPFTCSQ